MEFISHSEAETEALGEKLARSLPEHGVVIAMYGELGAGKTAFVRGLARGLEVDGGCYEPDVHHCERALRKAGPVPL